MKQKDFAFLSAILCDEVFLFTFEVFLVTYMNESRDSI